MSSHKEVRMPGSSRRCSGLNGPSLSHEQTKCFWSGLPLGTCSETSLSILVLEEIQLLLLEIRASGPSYSMETITPFR